METLQLILVTSTDGTIHALHVQDGSAAWHCETGELFRGPVLVVSEHLLLAVSTQGNLFAMQLTDGSLLWRRALPFPKEAAGRLIRRMEARLAVAENVLAVGYALKDWCGILAFAVSDGTLLWQEHAQQMLSRPPLLGAGNGMVVVTQRVHDGEQAFLTRALEIQNGRLRWSTQPYAIRPAPLAGASSLIVAGGVVYGYGAGLLALDAQTGQLLWQQPGAEDGLGGSLAAGAGQIFLTTTQHCSAYRMKDGAQGWGIHAAQGPRGTIEQLEQAIWMDGRVYVGRGRSNPASFVVEAWNLDQGAMQWSWPETHPSLSLDISWPFTAGQGSLYIPGWEGLYALDATTGRPLWLASMQIRLSPLVAVS